MNPILLDTCAVIWIADDDRLTDEAVLALDEIGENAVYVSAMTAWEIGILISKGQYKSKMSANAWFDHFVGPGRAALAELSPRILIASSFLPGDPPNDPTDRIIIATARESGYRLMTRDRKILDYAEQGHVQAIAC